MKHIPNGETEFHYEGKLVVVKNIDFYECETCGERVYSNATAESIMKKIRGNQIKEYVKVPVYS